MGSDKTLHADVVVIGGGLAGHCAALAAVEAGASCLLLEKESRVGGSTVLSGGFFALADTPEQKRVGVSDSVNALYDDLWDVSGHLADPDLLSTYGQRQGSLYQWLVSRGVRFSEPVLSSGQSVPRSHRTDPAILLEALASEAKSAGVRTMTGARVLQLIRDDENVVGCTAVIDGRQTAITAFSGVVIASGGFSHSPELLDVFAPMQRKSLPIGGAGNVGDGLRMAWALGADVRDMGHIKGTFGTHPTGTTAQKHSILLTFYKGAIVVNEHGARFVDESLSYKDIGDACLSQPNLYGVQVFDSKIADDSNNGIPLFDLSEALASKRLVRSNNVRDLATLVGVRPDGLERTLQRYNSDIRGAQGDSEFGRDGLCHGAGELLQIETPPFYAYPSTTAILATYCGLRINSSAQVIDVWGEAIGGLFAAGEVTGGFHGAAYMTGSSLGKSAIFGRIAGLGAASAVSGT